MQMIKRLSYDQAIQGLFQFFEIYLTGITQEIIHWLPELPATRPYRATGSTQRSAAEHADPVCYTLGMSEQTLSEVLTPTVQEATSCTLHVASGWDQGKGAYGGLVLGSLVRAVELTEPDPQRMVRAIAGEIPAPVEPGASRIKLVPLRRGGAVSTVRAELLQTGAHGDEVRAHVVVVTASARANMPTWQSSVRPDAPHWQDVAVVPVGPPFGPTFGRHFEFRVITGMPFSGSGATALGYIRARSPGQLRSAAYITALADAWWPCALAIFKAPRPTATLTFALNIINTLDGLDPDAPLLHSAESEVSLDGYASETRRLWGHDGRLIAINHQTFVIIK